ncbi:NUMOD4 domain-containing protein, partial [Lacticaseibacillus paracasei]
MQIYKNYSLEDIPQEIWLPVPGFPKYEASNLGRVKSNVKRPKILRAAMNCR